MEMIQYIVPDDYPDIQSAIDAGPIDEFLDVHARSGDWTLNPVSKWPPNQIVVRPNLLLRGDGIDKTIVEMVPPELANTMRTDVITSVSDTANFTLQDLTVNQNATPDNAGSSAVYLRTGNHSDILFRRVKVINAFGAGLAVPRGINVSIEDCIAENVHTGITLIGCDGFKLLRNDIRNVPGNAIYPGWACRNGLIERNRLESAGDLAIDITSNAPNPPSDNIIARYNEVINGHVRVTNSVNIILYKNKIVYGWITVDSGQALASNVTVQENEVITDRANGIRFAGVSLCDAIGNKIKMLPPIAGIDKQIGMRLAIRGPSRIENNEITGSRDYGMDFAGWGLGGDTDMTILNNKIADFGDIGIYDNAKNQGKIKILQNKIYSTLPTARLGILTDYVANNWLIEKNALKVGELVGNQAIYAPGSTLIDNYEYTPTSLAPLALLAGIYYLFK